MASGVQIVTNAGNILLNAGNDVSIETINAGTASVSITAGNNLIDIDADADIEVDILSSSLLLNTTGLIGTTVNHIETSVSTLSANAGAGLFISESDTLSVDAVIVNVNSVNDNGDITLTEHTSQEFLKSTDKNSSIFDM